MTQTSERIESSPHKLYRLFDEEWRLLYIGISLKAAERFAQHSDDKPWWPEVQHITMREFPTRAAAMAAERDAIKADRPKYNIVHNRSLRPATAARQHLRITNPRPRKIVTGPRCGACDAAVLPGTGYVELPTLFLVHECWRAYAIWQERAEQAGRIGRMIGGAGADFTWEQVAEASNLSLPEWWDRYNEARGQEPPVEPPLAGWRCWHTDCDPNPDSDSYYWFGVERIVTAAQAVDWTAHLMEKGWLHRTNWHDLLRHIGRAHGWAVEA